MPADPQHRWMPEPTVEFQFPVDDADAPEPSEYRLAAKQLVRLLHVIDEIMIESRHPTRDWWQISLALKLRSSDILELSEAEIGRQYGLTKMAISKWVSRFRHRAGFKPNPIGYNGRL